MSIELKWKYLHYDADQLIWRYAKTRIENEEDKDIAQTSAEDASDVNLVRRWTDEGIADLKRILADCIARTTTNANDELSNATSWTFTLNSDVKTDSNMLAELMHKYVTQFCLAEWCKMYAPGQAEAEYSALNRIDGNLREALHRPAPNLNDY